jgi:putative sterol carrier protein
VFQRHQSEGLNATYHFTFTGEENRHAMVIIRDKAIQVQDGHVGMGDIHTTAESRTWLRFVAKEANIIWASIRRKIRIKGSPRLLLALGR